MPNTLNSIRTTNAFPAEADPGDHFLSAIVDHIERSRLLAGIFAWYQSVTYSLVVVGHLETVDVPFRCDRSLFRSADRPFRCVRLPFSFVDVPFRSADRVFSPAGRPFRYVRSLFRSADVPFKTAGRVYSTSDSLPRCDGRVFSTLGSPIRCPPPQSPFHQLAGETLCQQLLNIPLTRY